MIDSDKIDEVVRKIATKFKPYKIILFGSYANGKPDHDSDLDLLIIQDSDQPVHERDRDIRLSLIGSMIPIDILVYTRYEFDEAQKKDFSFLKSALKNSKVMYERTA